MSDFGNEKIDRETLLKMAGSGALRLALGAAAATTLAACAKDTNETGEVASSGAPPTGGSTRGPMNLTHCKIFGKGALTLQNPPSSGDGTYTVHLYKGNNCMPPQAMDCSTPFLHIAVDSKDYPVSCEYQEGTAPTAMEQYPQNGEKDDYHILVAFAPKQKH